MCSTSSSNSILAPLANFELNLISIIRKYQLATTGQIGLFDSFYFVVEQYLARSLIDLDTELIFSPQEN